MRSLSGTCRLAAAAALLSSCNLLVDVPVPRPVTTPRNAVEPLTNSELLRFSLENLGEVSPGLLYRTDLPGVGVLRFLKERVNLGIVVSYKRHFDTYEREALEELGCEAIHQPMSLVDPPPVDAILQLIRVTHRAREEGHSVLVHCRAGADRTGVMVGIWRMLFQEVRDLTAIQRASILHRHFPPSVPMTFDTLRRFRPELFQPFVDDPALLDDPQAVASLKERYFRGFPLVSGRLGAPRGELRAGVARVDLLEGLELPVQMATYGPFPGKAEAVRRPVQVRALTLDNGERRLALVQCDLLLIDRALRRAVLEALAARGLDYDDVLLAATHTHTSLGGYVDHGWFEAYILGAFDPAIRDHVVERIASAVDRSQAELQAASLGAGRAFVEGLSFNRRLGDTVDPEVGIVKVVDAQGAPLATLVNFAGHPILEPSSAGISPDFPGILCEQLDERHGMGLFFNGALGDLNACAPGRCGQWQEDGLAGDVARELLAAVESAYDGIETSSGVELGGATHDLELPPVNPGLIPDLLFPLDWALGATLAWPRYVPLQAMRVGEVALVNSSTELAVRMGLRIKRRSPSAFPLIVSHANGYGGYCVLPVNHALSKLDPTSIVCVNGSTYGHDLIERSCQLVDELWGVRRGGGDDGGGDGGDDGGGETVGGTGGGGDWRLSPAALARFEERTSDLSAEERQRELEQAIENEREALALDRDPTVAQTRRLVTAGGDSLPYRVRLEVQQLYLDDLRGGQGLKGRRRETRATVSVQLPKELELAASLGYARSDWRLPGGSQARDDGATDLSLAAEREFTVYSSTGSGSALRLRPRLALVAPTGKADTSAPLEFAAAQGVWRGRLGGAVEWTWNTYRTLSLVSEVTTAFERHDGRRPGELWESGLRYAERHGFASLLLDLVARVRFEDRRRGGRTPADVDEVSYSFGLRPGLQLHLGEHAEVVAQAYVPVGHSGRGVREGEGGILGLILSF